MTFQSLSPEVIIVLDIYYFTYFRHVLYTQQNFISLAISFSLLFIPCTLHFSSRLLILSN